MNQRHHIQTITASRPATAQVPTDVKLAFLGDVIEAAIPLFENKDPQNPEPPSGGGGGGTTT